MSYYMSNKTVKRKQSIEDILKNNIFSFINRTIVSLTIFLLVIYGIVIIYVTGLAKEAVIADAKEYLSYASKEEKKSIILNLEKIQNSLTNVHTLINDYYLHPELYKIKNRDLQIKTDTNGIMYKEDTNGGADAVYLPKFELGDKHKEIIKKTEWFDMPIKNGVVSNEAVVAGWYVQNDQFTRYYPQIELHKIIDVSWNPTTFNFYYEADEIHNPSKKSLWTNVYLDPAGSGWITSRIAPIYHNDTLQGVTGFDVPVSKIASDILSVAMPWNGFAFIASDDGMILAMDQEDQAFFDLIELQKSDSAKGMTKEILKPYEHNLLKHANKTITGQFKKYFTDNINEGELTFKDKSFLVQKSNIGELGWKVFLVVEKDDVLKSSNSIQYFAIKVGIFIFLLMMVFLFYFLKHIKTRGETVSKDIVQPIKELSTSTQNIHVYLNKVETDIDEIDTLLTNFDLMAKEIKNRQTNLEQQIKETEIAKNELNQHQIDLETIVHERTAQFELQKNQFEILFEDSSDGLLLIQDGKFVACNKEIIDKLGYASKDQFLHSSPVDISPQFQPDGQLSAQEANRLLKKCMEKGFIEFEWVHKTVKDEEFWCHIALNKIRMDEKDTIYVRWRDINKQKQLEKENRKKSVLLSTLLQSIPIPVFFKDTKGVYQGTNEAFDAMYGFERD